MSKQITLFGKISHIEPYFKAPKTDYERFVFLSVVLKDWEMIQNDPDAIKKYIEELPPPSKRIQTSFFQQIPRLPL